VKSFGFLEIVSREIEAVRPSRLGVYLPAQLPPGTAAKRYALSGSSSGVAVLFGHGVAAVRR